MSLNDCIGKTLKPWPILVDHYIDKLVVKRNNQYERESGWYRFSEKVFQVSVSLNYGKIALIYSSADSNAYIITFLIHLLPTVVFTEPSFP